MKVSAKPHCLLTEDQKNMQTDWRQMLGHAVDSNQYSYLTMIVAPRKIMK